MQKGIFLQIQHAQLEYLLYIKFLIYESGI